MQCPRGCSRDLDAIQMSRGCTNSMRHQPAACAMLRRSAACVRPRRRGERDANAEEATGEKQLLRLERPEASLTNRLLLRHSVRQRPLAHPSLHGGFSAKRDMSSRSGRLYSGRQGGGRSDPGQAWLTTPTTARAPAGALTPSSTTCSAQDQHCERTSQANNQLPSFRT